MCAEFEKDVADVCVGWSREQWSGSEVQGSITFRFKTEWEPQQLPEFSMYYAPQVGDAFL